MEYLNKEVILKSYPQGIPQDQDFQILDTKVSDALNPGEVLIKNLFMSVDPYMRGRMTGRRSYVDPFPLGEALTGGAVGRVIASQRADLPVGSLVNHFSGWRNYFVAANDRSDLKKLPEISGLTPEIWLGTLGMPGMTAYVGLLKIANLKSNQRVFVSGAAGAVGMLVGQIAKIKGCYVVGSCGSDEKASYLKDELGFDQVINYKKAPIRDQLAKVAGEGFDVYFDNIGGDHLEAALDFMKDFGHIAACGAISQYNATKSVAGPANLMQIVAKRLTVSGFIVSDHSELHDEFVRDMSGWLREGLIKDRTTMFYGIDQAVSAFRGLFLGENTGKALVNLEN